MLGRMDFLMRDRQFWESCDYIHTYTRKHIDRAIQNLKADNPHGGPRRYILAHELVQATNDQSVVCDQLLNVLFAGRDTPAVALTNVFFCIARNPRTWEKLREEVKGLKDDDLTMDRLKSLRYLQYVIKEGELNLARYLRHYTHLLIPTSDATLPSCSEHCSFVQQGCHLTSWRRTGRFEACPSPPR